MKPTARWLLVPLVALLSVAASLAQDARRESDFLDMVQRSTTPGGHGGRGDCTAVNVKDLLAENSTPEIQELLADLAVHPEDPALHNRLGNHYAKRSLWDKAGDAYRCALSLDDSLAKVWNNLGIVQLGQRNVSAAISSLERATKLDPDYALAYYNLGMAYDRAERREPALEAFERAITLDPKLATIAHNPHVAGNHYQTDLFLRRLRDNAIGLASSLDQ